MNIVKKYNGLNGAEMTREEIAQLLKEAKEAEQPLIVSKLQRVLQENEDNTFEITVKNPQIETLPASFLAGIDFMAVPENENPGMEKPVSPDEIYQYITDLMINTINKVGYLPWERNWEKTALFNGKQAVNFDSKKGYRGINYFLLNFEQKIIDGEPTLVAINFENPYFLTFNQIKKHKGSLDKGAKARRVIYFTKLHHHSETRKDGTKLEFSGYNQKKFLAWIKKNQHQLQILKRKDWTVERLANSYIPILKYYNVFHAEDITGIDWGELPENPNTEKTEKERMEVAEKIISTYPDPPKIIFKGDQPAYFPKTDQIMMTPIDAFKNEQFYYSTFFHELVHSTGHSSRLNRGLNLKTGNPDTDKRDYAFEELVAEMGAVFLCAESGILFSTLENSAKYLKGWNRRLISEMKEDNRFFFRAASKSQAAADYILDKDKDGIPAYRGLDNFNDGFKEGDNVRNVSNKKSGVITSIRVDRTFEITYPDGTTETVTEGELRAEKSSKIPQFPEPKTLDEALEYAKKTTKWTISENKNDAEKTAVLKEALKINKSSTAKTVKHLIFELKTENQMSIALDFDWVLMFLLEKEEQVKKPKSKKLIFPVPFVAKELKADLKDAGVKVLRCKQYKNHALVTIANTQENIETFENFANKNNYAGPGGITLKRKPSTDFDYIDYGNVLKFREPESALQAPRHEGTAKEALTSCGRLKAGYKYLKGGKIVKIKTAETKRKASTHGKTRKKTATVKASKTVVDFPLKSIKVDEKRFQNRSKLNESVVKNIVENYTPTQFDPIVLWTDPKNGKVYILAGHHRLEAFKRMGKKQIPARFANADYPTEKEAIKYARQLSNANRTLETPMERAKIYREMILAGQPKKEVEKAAGIEGKNKSYILNLAHLKDTGLVIEALERVQETTDKQTEKEIERIADWIGQARRKYDSLTNAHETEMFKFLMDKDASKRITTKTAFLQKIYSIVGAFDFNTGNTLNLNRFKYKTEGEKVYDKEYTELKGKINDLQDDITAIKERFSNPATVDYVKPTRKDYAKMRVLANEKIADLNAKIKHAQNKLAELYMNKNIYTSANAGQGALFGPTKPKAKKMPEVMEAVAPKQRSSKIRNIADQSQSNSNFFNVPGEVGKFFQVIERKPKHSVVITIDGMQGGGKTTFLYQIMNAFASGGNRGVFLSLEEHPDSFLAKEKQERFIDPQNRPHIDTVGDLDNKEEMYKIIADYDVIYIDSWQKLQPIAGAIRLDEDLRKKFDGKVFVMIFQQTTTGRTKGGSEVVFDGDIITKLVKEPKFEDNYAYFDKNRYTRIPLEQIRYNIASQRTYNPEQPDTTQTTTALPVSGNRTGGFVAVPID